MNTKRFRQIAIIVICIVFAVSVFFLIRGLPGLLQNNPPASPLDNTETATIEKRIAIIADDLTDNTRYELVMHLRSMFMDYSNIKVLIYDSVGETEKQSFYLSNARTMQYDAVVLYPIALDFLLPEIELLHAQNIPVIVVGSNKPNSAYLSVGFNLHTTGKLQAQGTYAATASSEIAVFSSSQTSESASAILKGFTDELANRPDIVIKKVYYTAGITESVLEERINEAMACDAIVIQDGALMPSILDTLIAKGYSGVMTGVASADSSLSFVLTHSQLTIVYQDPEQLNNIVFHELLSAFDTIRNNRFVETHQLILNTYNVTEYINE